MKSIYIIAEHDGIYEIVRMNDTLAKTYQLAVVQTNIRTHEKAEIARKMWQLRELAE
jgi:hypothetical protein